jgi:alginate O-acetyltransferase complex protein AlgJ
VNRDELTANGQQIGSLTRQLRPTRLRVAIWFLSTVIFLTALVLPVVGNIFRLEPDIILMEAPPLPLPKFEMNFRVITNTASILRESYLEKLFGFRKLLVRMQNILDVIFLSSSTMFDPVLVTPEKWLDLAKENNDLNVVEDFRGVDIYTQEQLDYWVKIYAARKQWLQARGIKYLLVVCPNKNTIYPDRIPSKYNQVHGFTRLDQLIGAIGAAGIDMVDLRPTLKRERLTTKAYYDTDSHWTTFGALAGYREIIARLSKDFPGLEAKTLSDFKVVTQPGYLNSLASMLALGNLFPEDRIGFEPKLGYRARTAEVSYHSQQYFQPSKILEVDDPSLPRTVVFRDSFAEELLPLLGEHFSRSVFIWPFPTDRKKVRFFDKDVIIKEKPDVVIEEFVERYFIRLPVTE